ncbi:hypothetical protein HAX54_043907 [Datura stramonium]|uniref:Uncharacterized protein n=1 Tax=Datura stramonium TaxID=4076 RepID=A0ABS8W1Q0_DATST|nr:hypothetical protein [Datura stramonium]
MALAVMGLVPLGPLDPSSGWRLIWHLCESYWVAFLDCPREGVKKIYRTLLLGPKVPKFSMRDVRKYSFLNGGEDEEASDLGKDSDEASASWVTMYFPPTVPLIILHYH